MIDEEEVSFPDVISSGPVVVKNGGAGDGMDMS